MTAADLRLPRHGRPISPAAALARRTFLDARTSTGVFAVVFALYGWLQAAGYHSAYPTLADRLTFARVFAGNDAIRLFYGYPYDVSTVGGYSAWRVGGTLSIAAAAFGMLAAVRALRAEEDAGRSEIVLAGAVGRGPAFLSALAAIAAAAGILWVAELLGFLAGGLPFAGSAYLALATVSVVPTLAGVGALASQLAPTRRVALAMGSGAVAVFWLLRVLSDTVTGGAWIRWATPLGWAEELRPFAVPRPLALLLPLAASLPLLAGAGALARRRDVGTGILRPRDTAAPRYRLLSSPTAQTVRREAGTLLTWSFAVGAIAAIFGMISPSVSSAGLSANLQKDLARLGAGSVITPTGYLSFVFIMFMLAASLFVCSQIGAARQEEAGLQLETVLALPVSRYRWLGGRLVVAASGAAVLSGLAGLLTWAGAASQGVTVPLSDLMEAGANCLPVSLFFLGISALTYALAPRVAPAVSYSLVGVAFLWYLVGSLLQLPGWVVDLTPFRHVGLVPAQRFRTGAALAMAASGVAAAMLALAAFRRRDITGT